MWYARSDHLTEDFVMFRESGEHVILGRVLRVGGKCLRVLWTYACVLEGVVLEDVG